MYTVSASSKFRDSRRLVLSRAAINAGPRRYIHAVSSVGVPGGGYAVCAVGVAPQRVVPALHVESLVCVAPEVVALRLDQVRGQPRAPAPSIYRRASAPATSCPQPACAAPAPASSLAHGRAQASVQAASHQLTCSDSTRERMKKRRAGSKSQGTLCGCCWSPPAVQAMLSPPARAAGGRARR